MNYPVSTCAHSALRPQGRRAQDRPTETLRLRVWERASNSGLISVCERTCVRPAGLEGYLAPR